MGHGFRENHRDMRRRWTQFWGLIRPSYGQKLFLLATLPLILAVAAISIIVAHQSRALAEREIAALQDQLIEAKRAELKNYQSLARTAFISIYGRANRDDAEAKLLVSQILSAMIYGRDGYFFVFDYDGTALVAPRQTDLINKNWSGLTDDNGVAITDALIEIARTGGGYHSFNWTKPSTGETAPMIAYMRGLPDWRWAVGTGIFVDDIMERVAVARAEVETRIQRTFLYIGAITLVALLMVFTTGMTLNIRERRLADVKLKELTQRIFDTQEEERGRVARELHDSISQILVAVRYALELAQRRAKTGDTRAGEDIDKGIDQLNGAIQEVRRISRDLRPGVLDDLGLGPALQSLIKDFSTRTGIDTEIQTVVFRNLLDQESKIALYRVAQEALTNIERHANATSVSLRLRGHRRGATLQIADNGHGFRIDRRSGDSGIGLRNMQERIEQLDGRLDIRSTREGTVIEALVPLSHILPPSNTSSGPLDATIEGAHLPLLGTTSKDHS